MQTITTLLVSQPIFGQQIQVFETLSKTLKEQIGPITGFLNIIIAIVALVYIGKLMFDIIKAFSKKSYNEGVKHIGAAIVVALIAAFGVIGLAKLSDWVMPPDMNNNDVFNNDIKKGGTSWLDDIDNKYPGLPGSTIDSQDYSVA